MNPKDLDDYMRRSVAHLRALEARIAALEELEQSFSGIYARVYNNANISIPDSTVTVLTFNNERVDPTGLHSTVLNTGRFTIKSAGFYLISGQVDFDVNNSGRRHIYFKVNNLFYPASITQNAATSTVTRMEINTLYFLNVDDYIEFLVYQNSGGALDVRYSSAISPEFSIARIA